MSERSKVPSEESFRKDVSKHELTVKLDNGVYRHLRLSQPSSSNMWFDIVTWPGFLAYAGDMGSFVFSRLDDMFQFFRTDSKKDGLRINPDYWGEKLEAVDCNGRTGSHKSFSADKLREHVEDVVKTWVEEFHDGNNFYDFTAEEIEAARKEFETELREAIKDDIYYHFDEGEHESYKAVNEFSFKQEPKRFSRKPPTYRFSDIWEWNCDEYTYHFVWCCYALAWAIKQYDSRESTEAVVEVVIKGE